MTVGGSTVLMLNGEDGLRRTIRKDEPDAWAAPPDPVRPPNRTEQALNDAPARTLLTCRRYQMLLHKIVCFGTISLFSWSPPATVGIILDGIWNAASVA